MLVAATAPGQTAAVSVFIDPMIAELGISRSAVSLAYLVGTLSGAAAMPFVGRALDRYGARRVMVCVAAVFAVALFGLSAVSGIVGLTAGFVVIRMAGQGALNLAATTVVALWFHRRRGTAIGIVGAIGASAISLAPVLLERLIAHWGWRTTWLAEGVFVAVVVIPIVWFAIRDRPADLGQRPDGVGDEPDTAAADGWGMTRAAALRTPFFWVLTAMVASIWMLVTGINFHQISLLTAQGLTTVEAAGNFIPQTIANLAATFAAGYLTDRIGARYLILASMATLAAALAIGTSVTSGMVAIAFGALVGTAGGAVRGFEAATFTHHFGTRHIGAIRGVVTAISVAASAFGPLLFATIHDVTDSYAPALLGALAFPAAVMVAAIVVPAPSKQTEVIR
ncbi:MFS transporter [Haloechinothrix salitolerans]|uniref:MFS transporter n=1 Tax=Haloechinothrix salitolerans TaxID=926830 RepID=A0ABW2C838_9PSEU